MLRFVLVYFFGSVILRPRAARCSEAAYQIGVNAEFGSLAGIGAKK